MTPRTWAAEALWSVVFLSSTQRQGGGVIVLETDRVFGGDSSYFYVGNYDIKDNQITFAITVTRYNDMLESIFGNLDAFSLTLQGAYNDEEFNVNGHIDGDPTRIIEVNCRRRAELP